MRETNKKLLRDLEVEQARRINQRDQLLDNLTTQYEEKLIESKKTIKSKDTLIQELKDEVQSHKMAVQQLEDEGKSNIKLLE